MSLSPYLLDERTRESYLRNYYPFAKQSDMEGLRQIIESVEEPGTVRGLAKYVLEELEKKYPSNKRASQ